MTDPIAEALIHAHRTGCPQPLPGPPRDAPQAYAIQAQVAARLGPVGGFKVAARPGVAPTMAPIMAGGIVPSGARWAASGPVGVELEIGFRLDRLPDGDLSAALTPVAVIELVGTRLTGRGHDDPMAKLADFQTNAGLVVGPDLTGWDGRDVSRAVIEMQAGETEIASGPADLPGGSALAAVTALIDSLGSHCGGLQPGQIVITGSLHPLTHVDPPCTVTGRIDGFGTVTVTLDLQAPGG